MQSGPDRRSKPTRRKERATDDGIREVHRDADIRLVSAQVALAEDRAEDAIRLLTDAATTYREVGADAAEGEAEVWLWQAYRTLGISGGNNERLAQLHASRAEKAFRRADDAAGIARSLTRQIVGFADSGDELQADFALSKLDEVDPASSPWWRRFAQGTIRMTSDPDSALEDLRACASADASSMPEDADHWRRECERKIFTLTGDIGNAFEGSSAREGLARAMAATTDADAEKYLRLAVDATERARLGIRSVAKQREISASSDPIYHAAAVLADRAGRFSEAVDLIELNTSRSALSEMTMRGLWARSPRQFFEILAQTNRALVAAIARTPVGADPARTSVLRTALKRRREAGYLVEEELVRVSEPPHTVFRPVPEARLRTYLAEEDGVVVFSPYGAVYGVDVTGVAQVASIDPERLAPITERVVAYLASSGSTATAETTDAIDELIRTCIDPIRPFLSAKRRAIIVPTAGLWRVPIAVLGEDPLAAGLSVSYVPSLSVAAMLLGTTRRSRRVERFVGAANPDGTLPHAERELRAATAAFRNHAVQFGADVEIGDLFEQMNDADIVALACHAGFFDAYPELSWLQLGSADSPSVLWAADVIRIALRARLVVLSACHAGTSTELPGNEYAGLPGSFLTAGALCVLAPLWAVSDESTADVMEIFYRELPNTTVTEALWRAQTAIRARPPTSHPFHWAAFQLFGMP